MTAATQASAAQQDDEKNLTILEHLQELRSRLMICAAALGVAMVTAFSVAAGLGIIIFAGAIWLLTRPNPVVKVLVLIGLPALLIGTLYALFFDSAVLDRPPFTWPIWNEAATTATLEWLKKPAEARVENFDLVFTDPLEYWTTFFRVSLMIGITLAMPVFIWQVLGFIGPGLTKGEKRWAYPIVLGASAMFVAGCAFAYYIEMPPALNFLLDAGDIATPFISVRKYVDFATRLMLVTGLVFETPLLVMGLAKVGVVNSRTLLRWWRYAIVGAFLLSAVVTPSIDPITQTLVALPMIVLYFVGIGLAKLVENTPLIPKA